MSLSTLDGPGFQQDGPSLGSLKTAEEVAKVVRISAERILQLSRAQVLPHFRFDGGEPLFSVPILKAYVRRHLTVECEGAPLPLDLRPVMLTPATESIPIALTMVQDRLRECPAIDVPPCVLLNQWRNDALRRSELQPAREAHAAQPGRTAVGTRAVSSDA